MTRPPGARAQQPGTGLDRENWPVTRDGFLKDSLKWVQRYIFQTYFDSERFKEGQIDKSQDFCITMKRIFNAQAFGREIDSWTQLVGIECHVSSAPWRGACMYIRGCSWCWGSGADHCIEAKSWFPPMHRSESGQDEVWGNDSMYARQVLHPRPILTLYKYAKNTQGPRHKA